MKPYKLECINVQHAIIATLRINGMGYEAKRLGTAILTDAPMDRNVPHVVREAMARTTELSESDREVWESCYGG